MKVLVINCGSSSLKYQVFNMENEEVLGKGLVERIGIQGSRIKHETKDMKSTKEMIIKDHDKAIELVFKMISDEDVGVVDSIDEIKAIGHRVVHGGEGLTDSTIIDDEVKSVIKEYVKFAPLHNPANLMGIESCEKLLPGTPNVAVIDTAFHQTMPAMNYLYGIPYEYYEKYRIRKFGFHGTSHKYITKRAAQLLEKPEEELNLITIHLGNGSSLAAIKNGKSFDTSMGLTPLEGLIMGTRCGDLDPTVITFLMDEEGFKTGEINSILNKQSGVLGVSQISSDFRDLEDAAENGNERAKLTLDMFNQRVKRYLGSYLIELGHVDAICFAGGVGENSGIIRADILEGLEDFGIEIDAQRNDTRKEALISTDDSKIKVFVVPTNEELMIARDTLELTK